jgi:hypothetical protein
MEIRELQQMINEAISSTELESGVSVTTVLNQAEIAHISAVVSHKLPTNPDMLIRIVYEYLFQNLDHLSYLLKIKVYKDELIVKYITGTASKEEQLLLIFFMLNSYKNQYSTSITHELSTLKEYFKSYLIDTPQHLEEEIKHNPIQGMTSNIRDEFVRYDLDGKLIPTVNTILNFNNFIKNQENGENN